MRRALALVVLLAPLACNGFGKLDLTTLGRDSWQRPTDVVEALELRPGQRVADLGAGKGYFVTHLAEAVGSEGRVYAVDVDGEALEKLAERLPEDGNIEAILADTADPKLPDASIDLVLLVNTYHHIDGRLDYFQRLKRDLRPGGRVAVIEPNEDLGGLLSLTLDEGHTMSAAVLEEEMLRAGYRVDARPDFLPVQIFRVFSPDPSGDGA